MAPGERAKESSIDVVIKFPGNRTDHYGYSHRNPHDWFAEAPRTLSRLRAQWFTWLAWPPSARFSSVE